tara:strand:- start:991 stop:1431 length:441 start_codon:yes stop_codon:yes gene_type:complete
MEIQTTRFGNVNTEPGDILLFPAGLPGLKDRLHWVLLADSGNDSLGWLQSINRPELAFAVVSPRRFVKDYQVRVSQREILPLQLKTPEDAQVLAIINKIGSVLTINLKAPLLFHLGQRLGHQVVVNDDQPLQHVISHQVSQTRKSA